MPQVLIVDRRPTVEEYVTLTTSVGWSKFVNRATAQVALANSLFAVVAEQAGDAVGMGRIVGDGALFLYVQDVLVIPELQRCGVGHNIMARLMRWLDEAAPDRTFVGLFAASGTAAFYERYGFRSADAERPGMYQYIRLPE